MAEELVFKGRGVLGGVAEGPALISKQTIMGWGGIDFRTGKVAEPDHPLEGLNLKDTVLILQGSKGSNGWSLFFHAAAQAGFSPAALVFTKLDSRTAVTAAVLNLPLVTELGEEIFEAVKVGDPVRVDADAGTVTLLNSKRLKKKK